MIDYIRRLNKYAFILHLLSAIGLIIVYTTRFDNANFDLSLYSFRIKSVDGKHDDDVTYSFGAEGDPKVVVTIELIKILIIAIFISTSTRFC